MKGTINENGARRYEFRENRVAGILHYTQTVRACGASRRSGRATGLFQITSDDFIAHVVASTRYAVLAGLLAREMRWLGF